MHIGESALLHVLVNMHFFLSGGTKTHLSVPNTVRRAEAESPSISDLTVHVYVPLSPSFTLEMLRESLSFLSLRHKHRWGVILHLMNRCLQGALPPEYGWQGHILKTSAML